MIRRVVLDTNIVLSSVLFASGKLTWIRQAWQTRLIAPVVCRQTVQELLRVLAYPKFRLTRAEQEELLGDFLPFAQTATLPVEWPELPVCQDGNDQVFLALAYVAEVDALISGDRHILALRDDFPLPILTADELRKRLG